MDGPFLDGFVDERERPGKKFFRFFFIFVFDGLSDFPDLTPKAGFALLVDGVSTKTASPLADGRFVVSHNFLLSKADMIEYPGFKVKECKALGL